VKKKKKRGKRGERTRSMNCAALVKKRRGGGKGRKERDPLSCVDTKEGKGIPGWFSSSFEGKKKGNEEGGGKGTVNDYVRPC